MRRRSPWIPALLAFLSAIASADAGEVIRLSRETWSRAPRGKEADAIFGDWLLANDRILVVVADAVNGRNANDSCKDVGGSIIDLTFRDEPNDQLTAFIPANLPHRLIEVVAANGPTVILKASAPPGRDGLAVETTYELTDGCAFVVVRTRLTNRGKAPVTRRIGDKLRCDQTFLLAPAGETRLAWAYDRWFKQGYGVWGDSGPITTDGKFGGMFGANSGTFLDVHASRTIAPGEECTWTRAVFAGRHMMEVSAAAEERAGTRLSALTLSLQDPQGPVRDAFVTVKREGRAAGFAHPDGAGRVALRLLPGAYAIEVESPGRPSRSIEAKVDAAADLAVELPAQTRVRFDVKDGDGAPSPCKVQFRGKAGTPDPNLGPKERAQGCENLWYAGPGPFTVPLPAGEYEVIVSRGPAYDAVFRAVAVAPGLETRVDAVLVRSVRHAGWVSADFHNHSTESGDNTTEVEGRLLNLIGEGVEFAPSTEHNRVQSYRPWLKAMGLEKYLGTSDGIELSGNPFHLNHQNAFPVEFRLGAQDGGGPRPSKDPAESIRRLAEWNEKSKKLVQQNHPDFGELYFDKDGDGRPDGGHDALRWADVIEVFRTNILSFQATEQKGKGVENNPIFNWLQLLNQGHRRPGVANTDAHYCNHGSGRVRNYVRCSAPEPGRIDEHEIVEAARHGRIVMSTGPFLEVTYASGGVVALLGDEIKGGKGTLSVRVECPNWLDVDRVQLLVNGRAAPGFNFTRAKHASMFSDRAVKFDARLPLDLSEDAHLIVVAIGEGHRTSPVMGKGGTFPIAISNPIWVDADGNGFVPCKDLLGAPLPVKRGTPQDH